MECPICIEEIKSNQDFKCFTCNNTYCVGCMKTYLLGTSQEPHCLNCRNVIPYDQFVDKFDMKWRLGAYKKHKEEILVDQEKALMPNTVGLLQRIKDVERLKAKRKELEKILNDLDMEIYKCTNINFKKKEVSKYVWTQACLTEGCKGFLNSSYECPLCNKKYCKDCLEEVIKESGDDGESKKHECKEEVKETVKMIRKESKPCPKCGEFISKISGCDQMFCTSCGSAFSWRTGQIETGVIHNPHAHSYFQNNPEAYNIYMNNRNNGGDPGNQCRDTVPRNTILMITDKRENEDLGMYSYRRMVEMIQYYRRNIAEFVQYRRERIEEQLLVADPNNDLRLKYLKNEIDDRHFRSTLHMRNKKLLFRKQIHDVVMSTTMIWSNLLWSLNSVKTYDELLTLYKMFEDVRISTNSTLEKIAEDHNYKSRFEFDNRLRYPNY